MCDSRDSSGRVRLALDLGNLKLFSSGHDVLSCVGQRGEVLIVEVVCDRASIMSYDESLSPNVRVFMTEKEALWHDFEHGFS